MSNFRMNTEEMMKFVELYRDSECLWNTQSPLYKLRSVRFEALKQISNKMQIKNFGPKEVALKIKNLRTTYRQEVQKILARSNSTIPYKPKLAWFDIIDSLLSKLPKESANLNESVNITIIEQSNNSIKIEESYSTEDPLQFTESEIYTENLIEEKLLSQEKRLKISQEPSTESNSSEVVDKSIEIWKVPTHPETEFDLWAKSVAIQLNNMDVSRALKLQLQIQILITKERLEQEK